MIPTVLARLQRLQREMMAVSKSVFNSRTVVCGMGLLSWGAGGSDKKAQHLDPEQRP